MALEWEAEQVTENKSVLVVGVDEEVGIYHHAGTQGCH